MRPPCTPLPRRLGAYSAKSTERSHSITRWLLHWITSAGRVHFCGGRAAGDVIGLVGRRAPGRFYLVGGPAAQTVGPEGVEAQDLHGSLDAEVVQHAAYLQG